MLTKLIALIYIMWIKDFLSERKQQVVLNGLEIHDPND